jgi:hypothetical protein
MAGILTNMKKILIFPVHNKDQPCQRDFLKTLSLQMSAKTNSQEVSQCAHHYGDGLT